MGMEDDRPAGGSGMTKVFLGLVVLGLIFLVRGYSLGSNPPAEAVAESAYAVEADETDL